MKAAQVISMWAALAMFALMPGHAWAERIFVTIDISDQTMDVRVGNQHSVWPVSTARRGKVTPRGTFGVQSMKRRHYSSLYNNAPMPYSIFFRGNYAIHGTNQISKLGRPASAGCVRLHPDHARTLYELVRQHGRASVQIHIQN